MVEPHIISSLYVVHFLCQRFRRFLSNSLLDLETEEKASNTRRLPYSLICRPCIQQGKNGCPVYNQPLQMCHPLLRPL